jgi:hypothetical protein
MSAIAITITIFIAYVVYKAISGKIQQRRLDHYHAKRQLEYNDVYAEEEAKKEAREEKKREHDTDH